MAGGGQFVLAEGGQFEWVFQLGGILLKCGLIDSMEIQNKFLWLTGIPFSIGLSYIIYLIAEKPSKLLLTKLRK